MQEITPPGNKIAERQKNWLFDHSNTLAVFLIGIFGLLGLSLAAALTGTRFNGILNIHYVESQSLQRAFLENFINVIVLLFVLLGLGKYLHKENNNLIGIVNAVLISRIPLLLFPVFNINNFIRLTLVVNLSKFSFGLYDITPEDGMILAIFFLTGLAIFFYSIYLLYRGLQAASKRRFKRKEKLGFLGALVLAEVVSVLVFRLF